MADEPDSSGTDYESDDVHHPSSDALDLRDDFRAAPAASTALEPNDKFHVFYPQLFKTPRICNFCSGVLWRSALFCMYCDYVCHKKCEVKTLTGSDANCPRNHPNEILLAAAQGHPAPVTPSAGQSSAPISPHSAPAASAALPDPTAPARTFSVFGRSSFIASATNPSHEEPQVIFHQADGGSVPSSTAKAGLSKKRPATLISSIRSAVSKNRQRFVNEDFDLDLTYITHNIIAMSFPATGLESTYRNHMNDVAKLLTEKHPGRFLVFNLSERVYDISKLDNQVLDFGWPDHHAPPLDLLFAICKSMHSWLKSDPGHVVVVHCKGGKGRTGTVIASYMNYCRLMESAEDAMELFAMKRFVNDKEGGITQPSQRRYVRFFNQILTGEIQFLDKACVLSQVIINGIPNFDLKGGCKPMLRVYEKFRLVHETPVDKLRWYQAGQSFIVFEFEAPIVLRGDVLIKCYHVSSFGSKEPIFRYQFHTGCIDEPFLRVEKGELDDAVSEKRFPEHGYVDIILQNKAETGSVADDAVSLATTSSDDPSLAARSSAVYAYSYHSQIAKQRQSLLAAQQSSSEPGVSSPSPSAAVAAATDATLADAPSDADRPSSPEVDKTEDEGGAVPATKAQAPQQSVARRKAKPVPVVEALLHDSPFEVDAILNSYRTTRTSSGLDLSLPSAHAKPAARSLGPAAKAAKAVASLPSPSDSFDQEREPEDKSQPGQPGDPELPLESTRADPTATAPGPALADVRPISVADVAAVFIEDVGGLQIFHDMDTYLRDQQLEESAAVERKDRPGANLAAMIPVSTLALSKLSHSTGTAESFVLPSKAEDAGSLDVLIAQLQTTLPTLSPSATADAPLAPETAAPGSLASSGAGTRAATARSSAAPSSVRISDDFNSILDSFATISSFLDVSTVEKVDE